MNFFFNVLLSSPPCIISLPKSNYPARVMSVSGVISLFNPIGGTPEEFDMAFLEAIEYARVIA